MVGTASDGVYAVFEFGGTRFDFGNVACDGVGGSGDGGINVIYFGGEISVRLGVFSGDEGFDFVGKFG